MYVCIMYAFIDVSREDISRGNCAVAQVLRESFSQCLSSVIWRKIRTMEYRAREFTTWALIYTRACACIYVLMHILGVHTPTIPKKNKQIFQSALIKILWPKFNSVNSTPYCVLAF